MSQSKGLHSSRRCMTMAAKGGGGDPSVPDELVLTQAVGRGGAVVGDNVKRAQMAKRYLDDALSAMQAAVARLLQAGLELQTGGGLLGGQNLKHVDLQFDVTKSTNPSQADDYAYGTTMSPQMRALNPYQEQHNAENFGNFAMQCKFGQHVF